jgi:hypothetical protein
MVGSMIKSWGMEVEVVETPGDLRKKMGWLKTPGRPSNEAWGVVNELTPSDVTWLVEVTEAAATEGLAEPAAAERVSETGFRSTAAQPRPSLTSPPGAERVYDVVIVDTPQTTSVDSEHDVMGHERAIDLMHLGCQWGERTPTVLLMAKHSTGQITFASKMLVRVPVRFVDSSKEWILESCLLMVLFH